MHNSTPSKPEKPKKNYALRKLGERLERLPSGRAGCAVKDLVKHAKLSRAQLTFYENTGLLGPALRIYSKSRPKRPRVFYSEKDVLKALIIKDMKNAGFSLHQLRTAIGNLEEQGFRFPSETHLLTDGESVYVADKEYKVIDILKRNRQMLLLVSIEAQIEKVPAPKTA